jgi:hypothetical protein
MKQGKTENRKKMSQEIDLCRDSGGDNGERPITTRSSKRLREKKASFNDANDDGPGRKTATGSAGFVVDLELADEVEAVSPHKKRRRVRKSEDAQLADHSESHESIAVAAAAASHPMNSNSEQTSRKDGSANKHSKKGSTLKPPSNASVRQRLVAWEARLSELADYRKIHGHCNVPANYSENSKLANWVGAQRREYRLHLEGKTSSMTPFRIQELKSLAFEWSCSGAAWEARRSELNDYSKIHGHYNSPKNYNTISKPSNWVVAQRQQWEDRLIELVDYRKIHGHCNAP